jgi:8-oxo-dGTP pyrophosphatase MutT (NUDIX family)
VTRHVPASALPPWLRPVAAVAADPDSMGRAPSRAVLLPPADGSARASAVLLLFGEGPHGPDLLLIERAHDMRSHAGQMAFPGGAVDVGDADPVAAALREAEEETGVDPGGVDVFGVLPDLWLPHSNFAVTPVLGWWRRESEVSVRDAAEVASVHRVPLAVLLNPANRFSVRHPTGYVGPAFGFDGLVVWGFTAGIIGRLFAAAGLDQPWDESRLVPLPAHTAATDRGNR